MNPILSPVRIILVGLIGSQIIATIQVYFSNQDLLQTLFLLKSNGYYSIPNSLGMIYLQQFKPAVIGGLFFTCTIGAGFTLAAFGATWSWDYLLRRNRWAAAVFILLWIICLICINKNGPNPLASLYVVIVPLLVSAATLLWLKRLPPLAANIRLWVHVSPVIVLALFWLVQMNSTLFSDIRDNLLLSNAAGTRFNDLYYKYTLYPARIFKSLDQKLLKTCNLSGIQDKTKADRTEAILRARDYLSISEKEPVDLAILEKDDTFVFQHKKRTILRIAQKTFFTHPDLVLQDFSYKNDRNICFRRMTYISLLFAFPLTLYLFIHGFFRVIFSSVAKHRFASVLSSMLCFVIGISIWLVFQLNKTEPLEQKDIPEAITSDQWQDHVSALKALYQSGMGIGSFRLPDGIDQSPHIPVRYWLAKVLAINPGAEAGLLLLKLLDDPNPNVVCMAIEALGKRRDTRVIGTIMNKIDSTDHWYVQWYGYKALRVLGWKQPQSKQKP